MPHINFEASAELARHINWVPFLTRLHAALADAGWAGLNDLKSRVQICHTVVSGLDAQAQQFVAVLVMTNPRPEAIQQAMAQTVLNHMQQAIEATRPQHWVQCCVFFRHMPKTSYLKWQWHTPLPTAA
jgi:5-carboxymethyl-2-hydroxymuconate isomerase